MLVIPIARTLRDRVARLPLLRRLAGDRRGVAMIELAIATPVLATIAISGIEIANLAVTIQRINQLAMMAADNGGRVRTSMDELDVNEIMTGVAYAGREINFGKQGRLILSSVKTNDQTGAKAGYTINWQRCFGKKDVSSAIGAEGYGATTAVMANGVSDGVTNVKPVSGSALMLAEIKYTYKPIVALVTGTRELTARQVFPVRERTNQTLTNTSLMTDAKRRLCDAAHLSDT